MSYTPLDSDLLTSTLLKEGPVVVSAFVLILASRDRFGETSIQPATVASLLRISDEEAEDAFRVLSEPDPKSRNRDCEGRRIVPIADGRWMIVSSEKYQYRASKASAAERQRKHRGKVKAGAGASAEVCAQCGSGEVEGAVGGEYRCRAHWPAEDEGGPV
jgi:hypothetical protein